MVHLLLEKLGYRADIVSDGREVLEALKTRSYDVILMDIRMPEMDGLTATHYVREILPPDKHPFIVAMTAESMQGDREKFLAAGMDDYIPKPIRIEELKRALSLCQPCSESVVIDEKIFDQLRKMAGKQTNEIIEGYLQDASLTLEGMR